MAGELSNETLKHTRHFSRFELLGYLLKEAGRMQTELDRMMQFEQAGGEHYMLSLGIADYTAERMILEDEIRFVSGDDYVQS